MKLAHPPRPLAAPRALAALAFVGALTLVPRQAAADPTRQEGQHFTLDPVTDGLITIGGAGFSGLLSLVLSTGEIRPQPLPPNASDNLLSIDHGAVTQTIDKNAGSWSNVGLYSAGAFAVVDSVLSGFRDGWDAAIVDALLYAESVSVTTMLTDITKIAVRRPRPIDYINCEQSANAASTSLQGGCSNTDMELSFFSGHAATVATIGATATYLAFVREPHTPRPWITLATSVAVTTFVSYERVRSGNHFPTDVIAGAMAGAAVGVLVPHLHRHTEEAPPVWIGVAPAPGGGSLSLQATF
jgi:undecaprenyl-diphosphatase